MIKKILGFIVICYLIASCKPLNPSIMFKTPKNYAYDQQGQDTVLEYVIAPNDIISFRLFANNGIKLVDVTDNNNAQQFQQLSQGLSYLVEHDGKVNLPSIGRVKIDGKTIREAELYLEGIYDSVLVNDPFILLNVINRRVTIFTGDGGSGTVITLANNNIKLIEALALAGGISQTGRAGRIKLIRGDLSDPEVYKIDLSTIDGLQQANIILQADDIIYIEPVGITTRQALSEISPILGLVSSIVTLILVIDRL